jgi:tRNA pseudouridine55 synthase
VRRLAGQKRVGHAGTLDPMAQGVLPVLMGRATRLADDIQHGTKSYVAVVKLGSATDTDDAEGGVVAESPVPNLSEALLRQTLGRFEGAIEQTPPRYSALKVDGQRAYKLARAGTEVELAPRRVVIHELRLLSWSQYGLQLDVTCSKGTYVRALARDVAIALGTLGHLTDLTRTRVGMFLLEDALTLDEIANRGVEAALLPASRAVPDIPSVSVTTDEAARLLNGQTLAVTPLTLRQAQHEGGWLSAGLSSDRVWVYDATHRLVCLAQVHGGVLQPRLML